jgi:hypothetical protein
MKLETASRPGWPGQLSWAAAGGNSLRGCVCREGGKGVGGKGVVSRRRGGACRARTCVRWGERGRRGIRGASAGTHPGCRRCRRCHRMCQRHAADQSCSKVACRAGVVLIRFVSSCGTAVATLASALHLPANADAKLQNRCAALTWPGRPALHTQCQAQYSLVAQLVGEGTPLAVPLVRAPRKGAEVHRHHLGGICLIEAVWHVGHDAAESERGRQIGRGEAQVD